MRIARQVSHPNVCRVYDIGEIEGMPFISMEYVDGEDLASLLLRIGRLPADKALETARKLCAGLAAAHDRGIIHRDLKPQNIMMNKRGDVVIMDFGLAAIADQLSGAEVRNGTPAYMAPEQLRGSEVTATLLEFETLDGQQVDEIVCTGKFTPPPPTPQVDPPRGAPAGTPLPEMLTKPAPPKLPGLGHSCGRDRVKVGCISCKSYMVTKGLAGSA